MKKVFISYSQKDKEVAAKVKAALEADGDIKVTIDGVSMAAGGDIRAFIDRAIRETNVTLSIVSKNSLASDWVALESVESFAAEKYVDGKKFIACHIDKSVFKDDFSLKATRRIDQEITKLEDLISQHAANGQDPVHLQSKKTRKYDLRNNLSKILDRLLSSLTLDISEPEFDRSLDRIIEEIRKLPKTEVFDEKGRWGGGSAANTASGQGSIAGDVQGIANTGTLNITNNYGGDRPNLSPVETSRAGQREKEIAYLRELQKERGQALNKYTPLAGKATEHPLIKPVYEHKPLEKFTLANKLARTVEPRRFDDAVGEILKLKRAVVLGEPGAGKTTTLWKLVGDLNEKALLSESDPLPLLIRLGDWTLENQPFVDFLLVQLGDLSDQLERLLKENRAVLLLDGLNELPAGQRKGKTAEIRQFIDKWSKVTAIISCRQLDYTENELEMDRVEIVPLDPIRIRQFVCRYLGEEKGDKLFWRLAGKDARKYFNWFLEVFKEKLTAPEEIFWNAVTLAGEFKWWRWEYWLREREHPSSLMVMARNPFMLMMLYSVYDEKLDTLPENRGRLFEIFAETLFERERVEGDRQKKLASAIALVAYQMQTRRTSQEQGDALTVLPRSEVLKTLDEDQLKIATRASILSTGEEIRFTHQLLQEYFAARHMDEEIKAGRLKAESLWPAEKWWERNNWEETTVLLAGLYSDDCTQIIDWIADANPEVAAMCIKRSGANCPPETLAKMKKRWLPRLTDLKRDKDPKARAAVGRALGMTGLDDRKGVGTILDDRGRELPDIDWIEIPGGEFLYGDDKETRKVGSFAISRFPVTYKQFQVFIDDPEGIRDKRWFKGLTCGDGEQQPSEQAYQYDNHPRESVSWYQAVAFCRWLSWRMDGEYKLKRVEEWKARLPTEEEWERAARGIYGREYPYGDEYDKSKGNSHDTGIGMTSAVGIFPDGKSLDGLEEMSGNVWQWCIDECEFGLKNKICICLYVVLQSFLPTKHKLDTVRVMAADRVLRGGGYWYNEAVGCSEDRLWGTRGYRNSVVGFRLSRTLSSALLPSGRDRNAS